MPGKKLTAIDPRYYRYATFTLVFIIITAFAGVKFVANSTTVTAASPLYPVKLFAENTILFLAEPDDRAKIQVFQLKQRVIELRSLELRAMDPRTPSGDQLKIEIDTTRSAVQKTIRDVTNNLQFIKSVAERSVIEDEIELARREVPE